MVEMRNVMLNFFAPPFIENTNFNDPPPPPPPLKTIIRSVQKKGSTAVTSALIGLIYTNR